MPCSVSCFHTVPVTLLPFSYLPSYKSLVFWPFSVTPELLFQKLFFRISVYPKRSMIDCLKDAYIVVSVALVDVPLQNDQVLDVWSGHAGCSEHSQTRSLAHAVWLHHITPPGAVEQVALIGI